MSIIQLLTTATWHQKRADNVQLDTRDRDRHGRIAYRFFRVAYMIEKGMG